MIEALTRALGLISDYFLDGFIALLAVAVAAPLLGVLLILRRMPLLALAIPQLAGCGQAAGFFAMGLLAAGTTAPEAPGPLLQLGSALAGVFVGLGLLLLFTRDRRFLGVHAGVAFVVALGLREILYLESPYPQIFEESLHHGRLLTVGPWGRTQVLLCSAAVVAVVAVVRRQLWVSAFDPDQGRLLGVSPGRYTALTLMLVGGFCALCVPVVGPDVVLTQLLVPAAVLRPLTPSLRAFAPLAVLAGLVGAFAAFVIACTEGVDWPPGPVLVLCDLAAAGCIGAVLVGGRRVRGMLERAPQP